MKTKFCLLAGIMVVALSLSFSVARAQSGSYGGQKNATSSSTTTRTGQADTNTGSAKPGSSLGGGKYVAIIVTPEEAAKKYPPPNGKTSYPNGMDEQLIRAPGTAAHSGFIKSPYSSRVYDCRKIGEGTLLLDDVAKKVFVRPPTR